MPEQLGLAQGGRRRTPGLRREEVAQHAGSLPFEQRNSLWLAFTSETTSQSFLDRDRAFGAWLVSTAPRWQNT
jgi:hypothetical protein